MQAKVFTVSELTNAIKGVIEPQFRGISVQGEISNFKLQASGHLYFSLKDAGSQISSVLFKGNAANLPRMPKEGDQVVARGEISLYAPRGQYQIIIRELQFLGVGELLLKLHQLKEMLHARGWFDPQHKKPLPKLPRRIGVVTSPTGAVIQDILHVLTRRFAGFQVTLNPVKVQGEGAALEIAQAIRDFNKYNLADVLIVGRGGGSIEDLWAFNEEIVAQAIFESKIPVISAVGHETDFTIADWVADVRAPTPSAAAEIAIAEKANLIKFLQTAEEMCKQRISQQIRQYKQQVAALQKHPLLSSPYGVLSPTIQRLDEFTRKLEMLNPKGKILENWDRLNRVKDHLRSMHPQNVLKKGYTIIFSEKDDSIILSAKNIQPGQKIRALFHDGKVDATTNEVLENGPGNSLF
ncbi:MAG: exodeoxyribonuclease VII large subunit [Chlamydiae bacterium CG10_big_fil_rev_8_21_14_0_10_42_34]|nr:MAG: exodeoxyribonuclease VII large subunit [Chlamydiae bacterium CG10_big_fil_rev_8_21_14_0_10_42_34]